MPDPSKPRDDDESRTQDVESYPPVGKDDACEIEADDEPSSADADRKGAGAQDKP